MPTTLTSNVLNLMCAHIKEGLLNPTINLHVDYVGFSALVYENEKNTLYFTFLIDLENKTFIMLVQYFNEQLENLFSEEQSFKSLNVAIIPHFSQVYT